MNNITLSEFKRTINNLKFVLMMIIVIILGLVMIQDYRFKESSYKAQDAWQGFFMTKNAELEYRDIATYRENKEPYLQINPKITDEYVDSYEVYVDRLLEEAETVDYNFQKKEWKQYHSKVAYYNYRLAYRYLRQQVLALEQGKITEYNSLVQELIRVGKKYQYPTWMDPLRPSQSNNLSINNATVWLQEMRYRHYLVEEEIPSLNRKSITSLSFLYFFIGEFLPYLIPIVVALIVYDTWNKDFENGTLKLLFSQPLRRKVIVSSKNTVNFIVAVLVLFIPMFGVSLLLKITDGYSFFKFPVIIQDHTFSSFGAIENFMKHELLNYGYNSYIGISKISGAISGSGIDLRLKYIGLGNFLILSIILLLFFILFIVALDMTIASFIRNKYIVFILSIAISAIGLASNRLEWGLLSILNPFRYANPIAILGGYASVTALTSVVVLGIYSILLFVLGNYLISRQDIC